MLIGKNKPVDELKNEQFTPKWIFDRIGIEFDLDVAAPTGGAANVPAGKYYTKEEDGLVQDWYGVVWMNPPYSNAKPWVEKFIKHSNGMALLPSSKSYWFKDLWNLETGISFVLDPVFDTPSGKGNKIYTPVFLIAMGDICIKALQKAKITKVR